MENSKIKAVGFTEKAGKFKLVEINETNLGEYDILVKVEGIGMNPIDFKKKDFGAFLTEISEEKPVVIGFDASGVVEKIG